MGMAVEPPTPDQFADLPGDPDAVDGADRPLHRHADLLVAVAAGGALGAPARYGISVLLPTTSGGFPWGTFLTNISGSFALGALILLIVERINPGTWWSRYLRPFAGIGFLGAYTTYSTYALEVDVAVRDGHAIVAAAYAVSSLVAGLLAAHLGMLAGRLLTARKGGVGRSPGGREDDS